MTGFRPLALVLTLCLAASAPTIGATASASSLAGPWRFTHATSAPWGEPLAGSTDLAGQTLVLTARYMQGPAPLNCGPARLEATAYPAAGLFQGGLPAPAEPSAQTLGIGQISRSRRAGHLRQGRVRIPPGRRRHPAAGSGQPGLDPVPGSRGPGQGRQPGGAWWKVCWNGTSKAPWVSTKPPPRPRPHSSPRP